MSRSIPGTMNVAGREFMYIEVSVGERFSTLLDEEEQLDSDIPPPQSGGVIEEKVRIPLKGGMSLIAVSYKGDLQGWRCRFIASCDKNGRRWGIPRDHSLVLSDGTEIKLIESHVEFEP